MGKHKRCEAEAGFDEVEKKKKEEQKRKTSVEVESRVSLKEGTIDRKMKKKRKEIVESQETVAPVVHKSKSRQVCEEVTEVKTKKKSKKCLEAESAKTKVEKELKIHETEVLEQDDAADAEEEEQHEEGQEAEDLSPEERRTLERKLKKLRKREEKERQLKEGKSETAPEEQKPTAAQLALQYLINWSKKSTDWRFQKTRQTWLLQNMFDLEKISDQNFSVLLSYMEGLQGAARDTTVKKAETMVQELEEQGTEEVESQRRAERARQVIQLLF
ncbi:protein cholesin [Scleropages formosus]|nr:uncharacterized protein C7orf50 homolog [Scleropages formosus]